MEIIKAIIIEDESHARSVLSWELSTHCTDVEVIASCSSGEEGIQAINSLHPDVVFLDTSMPYMSGFDVVERLSLPRTTNIIFVSARSELAVKAFKVSAIDFLLKPISSAELVASIYKVRQKMTSMRIQLQRDKLLEQLIQKHSQIPCIALPTLQGLEFVPPEEIVHCKAENNYTWIHLAKNNLRILVSKPLKHMEILLQSHGFVRIHKGHLINLRYVKKYLRRDGGQVVLKEGTTINIARNRKAAFLNLFSRQDSPASLV